MSQKSFAIISVSSAIVWGVFFYPPPADPPSVEPGAFNVRTGSTEPHPAPAPTMAPATAPPAARHAHNERRVAAPELSAGLKVARQDSR